MTIIEKIKAEIERLYGDNHNHADRWDMGYDAACEKMLDFLDTLESEKPMDQDVLDKEIEKVLREGALSWNISYSDMCFIAEHFYELGCRRTAEKYDEIEYNRQRAEEQAEKDILALIESRISEIIGDAQPKPALRAELEELIKRIKDE